LGLRLLEEFEELVRRFRNPSVNLFDQFSRFLLVPTSAVEQVSLVMRKCTKNGHEKCTRFKGHSS
jgi:hypothetical protein